MTQQRLSLVDHVFSRHEHFDADQLMEQLPGSGQPGHVSRPTVYRTLGEFVDAGLLRNSCSMAGPFMSTITAIRSTITFTAPSATSCSSSRTKSSSSFAMS